MKACCIGCRLVPVGEPVGGGDLAAVTVARERQAREDAAAVEQHRARAALAVVAALLRAGDAELVAQRVEQGRPRVDGEAVRRAVHAEGDRGVHAVSCSH